jgi:hypothetical protein
MKSIFLSLFIIIFFFVWNTPQYAELKNELNAIKKIEEKDLIKAWKKLSKLINKYDKKNNIPKTLGFSNIKTKEKYDELEYINSFPYNRNLLLLKEATLAQKIAFISESPILTSYETRVARLRDQYAKNSHRFRNQLNNNISFLKKKYMVKKKYVYWKKIRLKNKKTKKKKIVKYRIPKRSQNLYYNKLAVAQKKYNNNIASEERRLRKGTQRLNRELNAKRKSYIDRAKNIYLSVITNGLNESNTISGLAVGQLALLYYQFASYHLETVLNDWDLKKSNQLISEFKKNEKNLIAELIKSKKFHPFQKDSAEKYFRLAKKISFLLKRDKRKYFKSKILTTHKKIFKDFLDWSTSENLLIKCGADNLLSVINDLNGDINQYDLKFKFEYKNFYLYIDSEKFDDAVSILNLIKKKIDKSEAPDEKKALQYIRYANQKANLYFLRGNFSQAADLFRKIREYGLKVAPKYGDKFFQNLEKEIDPLAGFNYHLCSFVAKEYSARYHALLTKFNKKLSNPYRPFNIKYSESELAKLKDLAKKIDSFIISDEVRSLEKNHNPSNFRLKLVQALIYLEINPKHSAEISEDVMYLTQEKEYALLEYYATILNGYAKLKMGYFRQARVDFTKVNTILTGIKSLADFGWIIGLGNTMIELEEYKYLNYSKKVSRKLRRARIKSLRYLINHMYTSLRAISWVKNPVNLTRLQAFIPYNISPKIQIDTLLKISKLYGQAKLINTCLKLKKSLNSYQYRNIYARYLKRKVQFEQYNMLLLSKKLKIDKKSKERLISYRRKIAGYDWNPKIEEILQKGNYSQYWRIN